MLAAGCRCPRPLVFDQWTCHKCGHDAPIPVSPSTWRIAMAIAEVAILDRYIGPSYGLSVRQSD